MTDKTSEAALASRARPVLFMSPKERHLDDMLLPSRIVIVGADGPVGANNLMQQCYLVLHDSVRGSTLERHQKSAGLQTRISHQLTIRRHQSPAPAEFPRIALYK